MARFWWIFGVATVSSLMSRLTTTNIDTTASSCFCFCSWQDSALTNVGMLDDRRWWLLRELIPEAGKYVSHFRSINLDTILPYQITFIPVCTSLCNSHSLGQCQELNWENTSWVKPEVTTWKDHHANSSSNFTPFLASSPQYAPNSHHTLEPNIYNKETKTCSA